MEIECGPLWHTGVSRSPFLSVQVRAHPCSLAYACGCRLKLAEVCSGPQQEGGSVHAVSSMIAVPSHCNSDSSPTGCERRMHVALHPLAGEIQDTGRTGGKHGRHHLVARNHHNPPPIIFINVFRLCCLKYLPTL